MTVGPSQPARPLRIGSVPNLRDVGGHVARGGSEVRTGLLYRSGALEHLADSDMAAFRELGLRSVYDLRSSMERDAAPDRLPPGADYVTGDVLADWDAGRPARLLAWIQDPAAARAGLGDGRAEALWIEQYRQLVRGPSARSVYGRLFRALAEPGRLPALVHCSGGKDRSGWAAAALLLLLGVAMDDVMADYVQSGWRDHAAAAAALQVLTGRGGDPELWRPIFSADPHYLQAAIDEVHDAFGSIEAYFSIGLQVDEAAQSALREAFLA